MCRVRRTAELMPAHLADQAAVGRIERTLADQGRVGGDHFWRGFPHVVSGDTFLANWTLSGFNAVLELFGAHMVRAKTALSRVVHNQVARLARYKALVYLVEVVKVVEVNEGQPRHFCFILYKTY